MAIQQQREFFNSVLNAVPMDIAVFDKDHRYLFVNSKGIADEHLRDWIIGKTDYDYCALRGKDSSMADSRRKKFEEAVQSTSGVEWSDNYILSDGSRQYLLRKLMPYFNGDDLQFVVGCGIDITQVKSYEIQLQAALSEQEHTNENLEQFSYAVSHDLQEPLRMVNSFLAQIEKKYDSLLDDQGKKYISFARDGAKRMRQIIMDLLDLYRSGKMDIAYEKTSIDTLVSDVSFILQAQADAVSGRIVSDLPQIVSLPKVPVKQVLQNLMSNALKYCSASVNPYIEVGMKDLGGEIVISVKDNGIGIAEDYHKKIFLPFARLHSRGEYEGTGIGLAITQKIVQRMGGRIWVESTPGVGSVFYFTIPAYLH